MQNVVNLASLLVVKMLIFLVNKISNSWLFLLQKCEKLLAFFQQKYQRICHKIFHGMLTNDIVRFEQLGPGHYGGLPLDQRKDVF